VRPVESSVFRLLLDSPVFGIKKNTFIAEWWPTDCQCDPLCRFYFLVLFRWWITSNAKGL